MKRILSLFFIFLVNIFSGVCFADVIDPNDPSEPKNWPWKNPVGIPVEPVDEPVPEPEILPDEIAKIVITLLLITNICLAIYFSIKYVKNIKRTIKE